MYILEDHMILYMRALQALRFCISENYSCNDRLISVSPENEPEYWQNNYIKTFLLIAILYSLNNHINGTS